MNEETLKTCTTSLDEYKEHKKEATYNLEKMFSLIDSLQLPKEQAEPIARTVHQFKKFLEDTDYLASLSSVIFEEASRLSNKYEACDVPTPTIPEYDTLEPAEYDGFNSRDAVSYYKCPHCNKSYSGYRLDDIRVKTIAVPYRGTRSIYNCNKCGKYFTSSY